MFLSKKKKKKKKIDLPLHSPVLLQWVQMGMGMFLCMCVAVSDTCKDGWVNFIGHCYLFEDTNTNRLNWEDAKVVESLTDQTLICILKLHLFIHNLGLKKEKYGYN